jgi:hypothetical protein
MRNLNKFNFFHHNYKNEIYEYHALKKKRYKYLLLEDTFTNSWKKKQEFSMKWRESTHLNLYEIQ